MSSPAKRKRDDSTSPTPTTQVFKYEHCDFDGARVARITFQSPPSPIQRGLKHFGLPLRRYKYDKIKMTIICSNCSSIAITKAYTPTKRDNVIFEGGCLKLLDIKYYSDRPSGKLYYVIKYNELLKQVDHPATEQLRRLLDENPHNIGDHICHLTVVKDITPPPQSSSIKLRQKCQSQLYLETQINLANAGLKTLSNKEYYKDYFNNEEKMKKSVEFAFRELIDSAELLCTYAKQLKDATQRGEEKEEITIYREDLVIKRGSYQWVTNPGMDPDGPRFKKFNATHWGSVFKGIDWYRWKGSYSPLGTFVKTGTGFIMKGIQWKRGCFPYETMWRNHSTSFQLKHMHLIHGIITLQQLKRYTKTLTKSIPTSISFVNNHLKPGMCF